MAKCSRCLSRCRMSPDVDLTRLETTLGSAALSRLLDALQRRIELGRPLTGRLTLVAASSDERSAIDDLFGRKSTRGSALHIDLDELAGVLREAGICDDLSVAVSALRGKLVDRRALADQHALAWGEVRRVGAEGFASRPLLHLWLAKLDRLGLVRRLSGNEPAVAATMLRELATVVNALPVEAEPLAAFAARLLGDAHALDPGTPRATLAVRAGARLGGIQFEDTAEGRRAAWASVGIMCDELSTPVLVFNLPVAGETPLGNLLRTASSAGEPVHVSLRMLLRHSLASDPALRSRDVFACENPTILALAAARLGAGCAPLVCVNGQFATPALVLLRQLRAAGARLHYHGDFDPAGLAIARRVMAESGALPWRFGAADYAAAPKGLKFTGGLGPTPWDPSLRDAMCKAGEAVHEEAVFDSMIEDLSRGTPELHKRHA
jgi:uncharacterized protein (TIGR02679 family)